MKYRKITTILILSTVFMGFFLTLKISVPTSNISTSQHVNAEPTLPALTVPKITDPNDPQYPFEYSRWIIDSNGNKVQLRGVSLTDIHAIWQGHRSHAGPMDIEGIIDLIDETGFNINAIRLPIHPRVNDETGPHGWCYDEDSPFLSPRSTLIMLNMTHAEFFSKVIDRAIQYCIEKGYYAIIDWHGVGYLLQDNNLAETIEFWNYMVEHYANHSNVIFELLNEPYFPASGGRTGWDCYIDVAEGIVNAIRTGDWSPYVDLVNQYNNTNLSFPKTDPANNLILIAGPDYAHSLPYCFKPNPDEIPYESTKFIDSPNIAYVAHIYPAKCTLEPDIQLIPKWMDYTLKYRPVIMTEWGYETTGPDLLDCFLQFEEKNAVYGKIMKSYLQKNPNLGWTAWCFDYCYHSLMFDCEWNLLGEGKSTPETRWHSIESIYHIDVGGYNCENYSEQIIVGGEVVWNNWTNPFIKHIQINAEDTYDNYMGAYCRDFTQEYPDYNDAAFILGDVNGDRDVDIVDALLIAQDYFGVEKYVPFYKGQADVNMDGNIDITDAQLIAEYYVGIIDVFPSVSYVPLV